MQDEIKQENKKDWYLVAINPWYRTLHNPKTGETRHERYR